MLPEAAERRVGRAVMRALRTFFAILFLVAAAAIFVIVWKGGEDHPKQAVQATVSAYEQGARDCLALIAQRFDSQNQNKMRAEAQDIGLTLEQYRKWWIAMTATQECA